MILEAIPFFDNIKDMAKLFSLPFKTISFRYVIQSSTAKRNMFEW